MTALGGNSWARESPIGKAGRVVVPTRGQDGPGEVALEIRGGVELFIARSPDPLAKGAAVICVSELGPRSIIVLPWADPKDCLLDLSEGQ